jgi:hypothetical protein
LKQENRLLQQREITLANEVQDASEVQEERREQPLSNVESEERGADDIEGGAGQEKVEEHAQGIEKPSDDGVAAKSTESRDSADVTSADTDGKEEEPGGRGTADSPAARPRGGSWSCFPERQQPKAVDGDGAGSVDAEGATATGPKNQVCTCIAS